MGRLIGGIALAILGMLVLISTITSGNAGPIALLIGLAILVAGVALAVLGWRFVAGRQRVLPVLFGNADSGDPLDSEAIAEETGVSVDLVRKHIQYAKMRNLVDRNLEVK